ncbi:MAG TPA: FixG Ig-like domain-containing protein, partial [Anaerolineales bacterium]|nr:FixG Ig-like domain-containing protein [Anaerolineales bacterium]
IVGDGGFETGTPNSVWNEASTNFGTPICDSTCGFGGGTGPHGGSWWAWFGGIAAYEEGSVSQNVTIPNGAASLSFWLEVPVACDSSADYLEVLLDSNQVFLVDGSSALCRVVGYTLQTVDIGAYADGGMHTLEFHSEVFGTNFGVTNFFVDDISIDVTGPPPLCSSPSDIPWISVSPMSGSITTGASTDVAVTFDTTGLTIGNSYTGTLCITSNDLDTPLVTVPVTLTVEAQSFGVALSADQAASADAGTTVVYTVTVTNTGNTLDTFDLTASGSWPATLSQATLSLGGGKSATFTVEVAVPGNAAGGDSNVTTVTATSQTNPTATDNTDLTTTVVTYKLYLPLIQKTP